RDRPARGHDREHLWRGPCAVGGYAGPPASMVIEAVKARPRRLDRGMVADEGLTEDLRDGQLAALCERMPLGGHDGARPGPQRLDPNPRIGRRFVTKRYVYLLEPGCGRIVRERELAK